MNQADNVRAVLLRILQDYLIKESEYNSVEFDAVYCRKTDNELAEEVCNRVAALTTLVQPRPQ